MYFDGIFEIYIIENPKYYKTIGSFGIALINLPIIFNIDPYYCVIVIKV